MIFGNHMEFLFFHITHKYKHSLSFWYTFSLALEGVWKGLSSQRTIHMSHRKIFLHKKMKHLVFYTQRYKNNNICDVAIGSLFAIRTDFLGV